MYTTKMLKDICTYTMLQLDTDISNQFIISEIDNVHES